MQNLTWIDKGYGCYAAQVGAFVLRVGWDSMRPKDAPMGYKVSFAETVLKTRFGDLEEAKRAGLALARRKLTEALAVLT